MEKQWILKGEGERVLEFGIRPSRADQRAEVVRPVLTVQEVCRTLKKSRRQIYRYLRAGRLRPCGRVLGQWFFSEKEIQEFQQGGVPPALKPFFWDVRISDLSVDHHQEFILGRLLEEGDPRALRWLFRSYSRDQIFDFLSKRGTELLSKRSWHFWTLQLGRGLQGRRRQKSWRQSGRRWDEVAG